MATVSPVADAQIRQQLAEGRREVGVPGRAASGSQRTEEGRRSVGILTSSTTSVGRVGKQSACRSSTATS